MYGVSSYHKIYRVSVRFLFGSSSSSSVFKLWVVLDQKPGSQIKSTVFSGSHQQLQTFRL